MMPNDPTRRSALSVALLAHANTGYEVDCWMAGNTSTLAVPEEVAG